MKSFKVWFALSAVTVLVVAGIMIEKSKSPVVSKKQITECENGSKLMSDALAQSSIWTITALKPEENQTVTGIPVFIPLENSSLLVGYKSDLVELQRMTGKSGVPNESVIDRTIADLVFPVMKNQGYRVVIAKNSAEHIYVFQKDNQILSLELHVADNDSATLSILCDQDISEEQQMYQQLSTNQKLNDKNNYSIDIWGYKDDVFHLNVIQKGSQSGSSVYTALINNKWMSLYEGQEDPQCKQLEKYKVGLGFDCFDTVSQTRRTVTY